MRHFGGNAMSLGNNRELAENKLILLHIIDKIGIPVSNSHITGLILENKFMNYFYLQEILNELCDNNFLTCNAVEDKTFYTITENGKKTLSYFINLIPTGIKGRIDNSIPEMKKNIKNETLITADFTPESENEYIVNCKVKEDNFTLIDLNLTVGTKNDARAICENWKKYSQAIYSEIIENLIKKRD
jgi:predicted transcriptional regulator